jgi:hypothetical protein
MAGVASKRLKSIKHHLNPNDNPHFETRTDLVHHHLLDLYTNNNALKFSSRS